MEKAVVNIQLQTPDVACQTFVDFDGELRFWRERYQCHDFYRPGLKFADYEPAIKLGIDLFLHGHGRSFEEMEEQLRQSYERTRGAAPLDWSEARVPARAAWGRMQGQRTPYTRPPAARPEVPAPML